MLSRLCSQILRALQKQGLAVRPLQALGVLSGGTSVRDSLDSGPTRLERVAEAFEASYRAPDINVDDAGVPSVEHFRDAIEDICGGLDIRRFNILFDEAAHIFRPEQQRQFFTLFRDLRSPYMTCNAAVYPGVTAYGGVFEMTHDARIEPLNRDIMSPKYLAQMREIVLKQAGSDQQRNIEISGENFDALAYAVTGNPRLLLKTVALAGRLRTSDVQNVLKEFFRSSIWAEHTSLSERYPGHKELINWGRNFVEETVIPETTKRNDVWRAEGRPERSTLIWIHRDTPEAVKEAIRLLNYTGILTKLDDAVVATRSQIGTRYLINIGCLVAPAANPVALISELRTGNTIKRFTEYGANYQGFIIIAEKVGKSIEADVALSLPKLLNREIAVLDLTEYQKNALISIGIDKIGKALGASEETFQQVPYIGPVRSRKMMNVVMAAALEYLSG